MTRRQIVRAGVASLALSAPVAGRAEPDTSDADLKLSLVGAVARRGRDVKDRGDVVFDVYRRSLAWQTTAWGWAYNYNTADHEASVAVLAEENRLRVDLRVTFGSDPWVPGAAGRYDVMLRRVGDRYEGSYKGAFETSKVSGRAFAELRSPFPALPAPGFSAPLPGEHPRLIFRKSGWDEMRRRAYTPWGRAVLAALRRRLSETPEYQGEFGSDSAYHAAGQAFLHALTGEPAARDAARAISERTLRTPPSKGGHQYAYSHHLLGLALAYDFAYDAWDLAFRQSVARYLEDTASLVIAGLGPGFNHSPGSNWVARTRGAAGSALLAILGETASDASLRRMLTICERSAARYLTYGMGDKGFGAEGDGYHVESMEMLYPFVQALRVAAGREMAVPGPGEPLSFGLPLYALRSFEVTGQPTIHRYGRHGGATRETPRSLFALGMASARPAHAAALSDFVDQYGGPAGTVAHPHVAPYALALYPEETVRRPYTAVLPGAVRDTRQGFFVFRSGDFVATLYARAAPAYGWNFPEAGTFRVHGLGTDWAVRAGVGSRDMENVVVVRSPENRAAGTGRVSFSEVAPDGSGAVSLDLSGAFVEGKARKDIGIRAERAFLADYSGRCGAPALFVLADRVRGGVGYTWLWHTAGESVATTDHGFSIQGNNGATLRATFLAPDSVTCVVTEQDGIRTISVSLPGTKAADFQIVVTVQQGAAPGVSVTGRGRDRVVRVGAQEIRLEEVGGR